MATKESLRVAAHRDKYCDRLSLTMERGGKELVRVLTLRDDCTITEEFRRAILNRAGLRVMPYPDQLEQLKEVEMPKEAHAAIMRLQDAETASTSRQHIVDSLAAEPSTREYKAILRDSDTVDLYAAITQIKMALDSAMIIDHRQPVSFELSGRGLCALRRLLANVIDDGF